MGRTQLKEELQVSAKVNFRDDGYTPSPLVIASAIGCRTHTMRIGTNLMLLPFYHPVRVAKDVATLSLQRFRVRYVALKALSTDLCRGLLQHLAGVERAARCSRNPAVRASARALGKSSKLTRHPSGTEVSRVGQKSVGGAGGGAARHVRV